MAVLKAITRNLKDGWALGPTFPLRHVSKLLGRKFHATKINGTGRVYIRPNSTDAETFIQVFRDKQYDFSYRSQFSRLVEAYENILESNQIPIIIDAGANVGAASLWFSKLFPKALVLAVEPDVDNIEVCRLNTRDVANVKLIEAAIGSESGHVILSNPEQAAWAVRTIRSGEGPIAVRTILEIIRDIQQPAKLLLVKIDIEGFEEDLFAKNIEWLDEVEAVIIEPHDWLFPGSHKSQNFQNAFAGRNFELLISGENLIYVRLRPLQHSSSKKGDGA